MKRKSVTVMVLLLILLLASCRTLQPKPSPEADAVPEKQRFGITFDSFVMERWLRDRDILLAATEDLNVELNVQNPNGDPQEQAKQIDYFVEIGCDAIFVVPIDPKALTASLRRAHEAGIKIIAYDRLLVDQPMDLYISFDNEAVGRLAAEAIVAAAPDGGTVAMIRGASTDYNTTLTGRGMRNKLDAAGNFTIIFDENAEEWRGEESYRMTLEALDLAASQGKKLDFICCGNDALALEAIKALATHRLTGKVLVTGQDADLTACQQIVEGTQLMTVYKPIELLATTAAKAAYELVTTDALPENAVLLEDGEIVVPAILLEPIPVTRENIDTVIIEGGFHRREDVYRTH